MSLTFKPPAGRGRGLGSGSESRIPCQHLPHVHWHGGEPGPHTTWTPLHCFRPMHVGWCTQSLVATPSHLGCRGLRAHTLRAHASVTDPTPSQELYEAAGRGDVAEVERLLLAPHLDVDGVVYEHGPTALHVSAEGGHVQVVTALLSAGANVNARNDFGATALYCAAEGNHIRVVKALLGAGAHVDQPKHFGWTPLHSAADSGHLEVVRALLAGGAQVDKPDFDNETPLYRAAINGHVEVAAVLLAAGATLDKISRKTADYDKVVTFLASLTVTQPSQPAATTQSSTPSEYYPVCFSAHPSQLPIIQQVAAGLAAEGVLSLPPPDEALSPAAQCSEWFPAAEVCQVVVCVVSREYLGSEACCDQFNTAKNLGKLMVVLYEPKDALLSVPTTKYNAPAKMHIVSGKDVLPADKDVVVAQLLHLVKAD